MRVIKLNIPLEQFKSRMPGLIPSFPLFDRIDGFDKLDGNGRITGQTITFTEENILTDYQNANYGMFPSDVEYTKDGRVFTYGEITSIRTFFRDYYSLLRSECCGNRANYKNAMEYYEYEGTVAGLDSGYFEELDRKAKAYGADTDTGEILDLYKDIEDGLYRSIDIPDELSGGWDRHSLCVTEVIDWRNWFNNTYDGCLSGFTDCCACQKYEDLGGDKMREWLNGVEINTELGNFRSLDSAWIRMSIPLVSKQHELGEMDELVEEWVPGMDYTPDRECIGGDGWFGTICYHEGKPYGIKFDDKGYIYDEKRHEIVWDPEQWVEYLDKHKITDSPAEPFYDYYAYKGNHIYVHPVNTEDYELIPEDLRFDPEKPEELVDKAEIKRGEFFRVDNTIIETVTSDYIIYNTKSNSPYNGKPLLVYDSDAIPYVRINGRVYYAYKPVDGGDYVFNFGSKRCGKKINEDCPIQKDGKFIVVGNMAYEINDGKAKIGNNTYSMFDGICDYDGERRLINGSSVVKVSWTYNNSGKQVITESRELGEKNPVVIDSGTNGYEIQGDTLFVYKAYTIYNANMVTGIVDSKLAHMHDKQKSYDDYGNLLPGKYYMAGNEFAAPKDGEVLDLYYHLGNVSNLEFSREEKKVVTEKREDGDVNITLTTKYFYGDIITGIEFYYKYSDGEIITETITTVTGNMADNRKFIEECKNKMKGLLDGDVENDGESRIYTQKGGMYCRITYRVGCLLAAMSTEDPDGYVLNRDSYVVDLANGGIVYEDELSMTEGECVYMFGGDNPYTLSYYRLESEKIVAVDEHMNEYAVPKANMYMTKPESDSKIGYGDSADYLIIEFKWKPVNGDDFDIRVGLKDDEETDVGWYGNNHTGNDIIQWAKDDQSNDGIEAVAVNIKKFYEDTHNEGKPLEISCYGNWYQSRGDGNVEVVMKVYHGGEPKIDKDKGYYYISGGTVLDQYTETFNVTNVGSKTEYTRESYGNMTEMSYDKDNNIFSFTKQGKRNIGYNQCHTVPVFRKPWKYGMNSGQNAKIDIYINRGRNQSHDKHLKLMEVKSIEAMEQYGNGFWDINSNT